MFYANLLFQESRVPILKTFLPLRSCKTGSCHSWYIWHPFRDVFSDSLRAFCNILSLCNYTDMIRDVLPDFR